MSEEFYLKILDGFVGVQALYSVPARFWEGATAPGCVREDPSQNGYRRACFLTPEQLTPDQLDWELKAQQESYLAQWQDWKKRIDDQAQENLKLREQVGHAQRVADRWAESADRYRDERDKAQVGVKHWEGIAAEWMSKAAQYERVTLSYEKQEDVRKGDYLYERDQLVKLLSVIRAAVREFDAP